MASHSNVAPNSSLHTLGDPGAESYIDESLNDNVQQPLLPPDSLPNIHVESYGTIPITDDIGYRLPDENGTYHNRFLHHNQYYIQHSYDNRTHETLVNNDRFGLSPVRRMFCLLSLFDCLFSFLLWLIYLQVFQLIYCLYCIYICSYYIYKLCKRIRKFEWFCCTMKLQWKTLPHFHTMVHAT